MPRTNDCTEGEDPWSWTTVDGVVLTGDTYAVPSSSSSDEQQQQQQQRSWSGRGRYWKNKLRSHPIPWSKTHTEQGNALMVSIRILDVEGVRSALSSFEDLEGKTSVRVGTTLLYGRTVRGREEEDAHDEALPPLHVLANAEVDKYQEADREECGNGPTSWGQTVEQIATLLLNAGADPAVTGNYSALPNYAAGVADDTCAYHTLSVVLRHIKARGDDKLTGGSASMVCKSRQSLRYGGNGVDIFWKACIASNERILPMVMQTLDDELGEEDGTDRKKAMGRMINLCCTYRRSGSVSYLLGRGGSPEGEHYDKSEDWCDWPRPLLTASNQSCPSLVQALIDGGACVHTRCVNGMPLVGGPLHLTCYGATVDTKDGNRIDEAFETCRRLVAAGCDKNGLSVMERKTPLQCAIRGGFCDMIRFLIVELMVDENMNNAENDARRHKKKSVGRAFRRSVEERDGNNGESKRVEMMVASAGAAAASPQEEEEEANEPIDFPSVEGEWIWNEDGGPIISDHVEFHPRFGLVNGDEQREKAKSMWGDHSPAEATTTTRAAPRMNSLEDDEDDESLPLENDAEGMTEGKAVASLAQHLASTLENERLQSETDSKWRPLWICGKAWYTGPVAGGSSSSSAGEDDGVGGRENQQRRSRRSTRTRSRTTTTTSSSSSSSTDTWSASNAEEYVRSIFRSVLDFNDDERKINSISITIHRANATALSGPMKMNKRNSALNAFANAMRDKAADGKALEIGIDAKVVYPIMIVCFVKGHRYPDVAGVYATEVMT